MRNKLLRRRISVGFEVALEAAEDGGYVVSCPALPGCHSQGETEAEALANIEEAIEGWLLVRGGRETKKVKQVARS